MKIKEILLSGAEKIDIYLSEKQISHFILLHEEIHKWGDKINLTALLNKPEGFVEELFLDSLFPLKIIGLSGEEGQLLDIGSGGGIPGIPIKIGRPEINVTLTDVAEKKIIFLKNIIRQLDISGLEALRIQFNDNGAQSLPLNKFDWAISKAVADTKNLGMWAHPHLKVGGKLICMKGPGERPREIEGYGLPMKEEYILPFSLKKRFLYIYEKK